jgi:lysophospholipase L1-like esterase/predicted esterase
MMPMLNTRVVACLIIVMTCQISIAQTLPADPAKTEWFSLEGKPVTTANTSEGGLVRKFDAPVLGITRRAKPESLGTVLLFPGGAYRILDVLNEGARTAETLSGFGYDVVMLEYHVNAGEKTRELALEDALTTWRMIKEQPQTLGLKNGRGIVMGYSAGGHLAARLVESLPAAQQPDDVVLVYPAYLEERAADATAPNVRPPSELKSRLVTIMAADDRAAWVKGAHDYVDAWQKSGGYGIFHEFKTGGHGFGMKPGLTGDVAQWPNILKYFLENGPKPGVGPFNTVLPWYLPNVEGRLAAFKKDKEKDQGAVVFLGDSITAKWNLTEAFPDMKVANRGISGDTTRGMFCRLQDNVLDLHPKLIVFMGGINDFTQQPKGTPQNIESNVRSMLEQIRSASPNTPVLICEILPSRNATPETLRETNAAVDQVIADFPNAHRVKTYAAFLKPDGSQDQSLFLDGTHPNPAGYAVWKGVLKPELDKYAGAN